MLNETEGTARKKYIVYGCGVEVLMNYSEEFVSKISYFVDPDPVKIGNTYQGKAILSPEDLRNESNCFILVSEMQHYSLVFRKLLEMGFEYEKDFIWAPNWIGNEELPEVYPSRSWEMREKCEEQMGGGNYDVFVDELSTERAWLLSQYLGGEESVMDLGAGPMNIKKYLGKDCKYIPVDYVQRSEDVIVCDLNKDSFPDIEVDCIYMSACLEWLLEPKKIISQMCSHAERSIILSYITIERRGDIRYRKYLGMKNHFSALEIISMFSENHFLLKDGFSNKQYSGFYFQKCI